MITCKEIDEYLRYMEDHPGWINRERWQLIENVVRPTLAREDIYLDEKRLSTCIAYCEKHYYPLFLYEKFILAMMFLYDQDNEPVFPEIVILEGRGNGKDGFMAPVLNYLQTPLHGIRNYHIEMVANSEQQIKDTFKIPHDMLDGNPKFRGMFRVTLEEIENLETGSVLRYNTSGAKTKDGKRPGLIFFNEYHAYETDDQINVYESAEGKVENFREIIITTNGYVRDGPLDVLLDECREILTTGDNPLGRFPFLCKLDDESEIGDMEAMHKANPSLEYMPKLQRAIERGYIKAKKNPRKWAEYVTKRCNLPMQQSEQAVTSWENILACCYADIEAKTPLPERDTEGQLAIIGIDYADVRDFASAGVLTLTEDGIYKWRQHTWICSASPYLQGIKFPLGSAGQPGFADFEIVEAPSIPIDPIIDWCEARMQEYRVVKICMDTYRYTIFKELFARRGYQEETKKNPEGLIRLLRRIGSICGIIAPKLEQLFAEHQIDFGDSAIMRWYTNNTAASVDKFGNITYVKIEPIRRKNDGFMAFVAALYSAELIKEVRIYV